MLVVKARTLEAKTKAKDQDPQGQDQGRGHGPQGQGQGQSSQGRGQGQGHDFLSSRILEAKACPRGLYITGLHMANPYLILGQNLLRR